MTPPPRLVPQAGPSVWAGADLTPADWMLPIGAEAAAALGTIASAGTEPRLDALTQAVAERLEAGRGLVLLRGLPIERIGEDGAETVLLALGARLGTALPQDAAGRPIQAVPAPVRPAPGAPVRFTADPADAVALLSLGQPPEGGAAATLLSAPALHNALLRQDRAALATLHAGLPVLPPAGGPPVMLPVFSTATGAFVGRCDHAAIAAPALDAAGSHALAALEGAAGAAGQALEVPLHPGDLLLWNPHLVWMRAGTETAPAAGRRMLRLWLTRPDARALPEGYHTVFGATAAGAWRGGVAPEPGSGPGMVGG